MNPAAEQRGIGAKQTSLTDSLQMAYILPLDFLVVVHTSL